MRTSRVLALVVMTLAACSGIRAEDKPNALVFCVDPAAMPRSGKTADGVAQGIDVAVARLVCRKLGRPFDVHWCPTPACSRKYVRLGTCQVILGHPLDEGAPKEIAWSVPYAGSQFGLVVRRETQSIRSLADLIDKRIGIVAGTVSLPESKHVLVRFKTREEVLNRFTEDKLDAAFIDADFAAWHLHQYPRLNLRLVPDFVPRERWNMALAVRADNADLLVAINKALADLAESGELRKAYTEMGVPYRPPFTSGARRPAPVDTWKRIAERGELRVAMDPANLPYSSAKDDRPGFDVELAREVARAIGLKLRIDWLDVQRDTAIGKLLGNDSDLAFGTAVDENAVEDDDELADKVIFSRPYYGTGYLLVLRQKGPQVRSLKEIKGEATRRIGTEAGSVADYRLRQRGYLRTLFRNQLAVLKALDDGTIDYAYLWANTGWMLHTTPEFKLRIAPGYVPEDHWNIAVAMRKGDAELKQRVDAALDKLVKDGTVARALARYHVPHFAPFNDQGVPASSSGRHGDRKSDKPQDGEEANASVIRHPVADRGLEPQMQKLQTSRNPYGGLERIRSAGALVVGLDPNNLPFSSADFKVRQPHPPAGTGPTGLDYEIAQLLAGKLGVSLRVWWGLSAHDSYPSKLATKKLCDVILGVMPDDRFSDRVLYSKPYYLASYRLVTRSGSAGVSGLNQLGSDPLAVESGVAVRGLEGRTTRTYPSLDAILEAVALNQVKAGYVISSRGQWLAERQWAGKLRFHDGDAADRFPICVAVRKSDKDLKAAIDQAIDELAESGKLAEVFARWHVPGPLRPNGGR